MSLFSLLPVMAYRVLDAGVRRDFLSVVGEFVFQKQMMGKLVPDYLSTGLSRTQDDDRLRRPGADCQSKKGCLVNSLFELSMTYPFSQGSDLKRTGCSSPARRSFCHKAITLTLLCL